MYGCQGHWRHIRDTGVVDCSRSRESGNPYGKPADMAVYTLDSRFHGNDRQFELDPS